MEDNGRMIGETEPWAAFKDPSERKVGCEEIDAVRIRDRRRGV